MDQPTPTGGERWVADYRYKEWSANPMSGEMGG